MSDTDPISEWLVAIGRDDTVAAERLWERYWRRVLGMARKILGVGAKGGADEEDVAQSALRSFFLRARDGRFPRLQNRRDLWNVLVTITIRKAIRQKQKESRQAETMAEVDFIKEVLSSKPKPEFVADLRDEILRLLALLDPVSQRVVGLLFEGQSNEEIAANCGVSLATIERKRKLIRETWRRELES